MIEAFKTIVCGFEFKSTLSFAILKGSYIKTPPDLADYILREHHISANTGAHFFVEYLRAEYPAIIYRLRAISSRSKISITSPGRISS